MEVPTSLLEQWAPFLFWALRALTYLFAKNPDLPFCSEIVRNQGARARARSQGGYEAKQGRYGPSNFFSWVPMYFYLGQGPVGSIEPAQKSRIEGQKLVFMGMLHGIEHY